MASRADAGRSGARMGKEGKEKRKAGHGSKDIGEPAGQMKQKSITTSPHPPRGAKAIDGGTSKAPSMPRSRAK
jgi:hypothetical protein